VSDRYKDTYSVLMIDQHFPDAPYITFDRFDAREQVAKCVEAHVDSLHITTKCHHGYYYYDTKIGVKHPALGGRDQVRELVEAAQEAGLEAVAYTCIQFDNNAVWRHPEWSTITSKGQLRVWLPNHRWNMPCINTGYRQEFLGHVREVIANYDFDGLFLDIFGMGFVPEHVVCFCPACLAAYRRLGLDPQASSPGGRYRMVRYWHDNWAGLLGEIKEMVEAEDPTLGISVNGGLFNESGKTLTHLDWIYSEGGENAHNAVALRNTGVGYPQCGIPAGNDAFDARPQEVVRVMTSTVLAHGCRSLFFFMQGREGNGCFGDDKYDFLGQINAETQAKMAYVKGVQPVTAVGIYHSEASTIARGLEAGTAAFKDSAECEGGIINAFRRISLPCELIPDWRLSADELARYQVVLLPEVICLSEAEAALFRQYVRAGGDLLVTGPTGLRDENNCERSDFLLADVMGVSYAGEARDYSVLWDAGGRFPGWATLSGFLRPEDRSHPLFRFLPERDFRMPGQTFLQVTPGDVDVLARIAEPVARETPTQFIGWLSLPPGERATWPAVTVGSYGRGRCVYVAAPLSAYAADEAVYWPARFLEGLVEFLGVDAGVSVRGPKGVLEGTFFLQGDHLIVHLLNQSVRVTDGEIIPLQNVTVQLSPNRFPARTARMVYPDRRSLPLADRAGRLEVGVPPVEIHTILALELA
jgi:hypothetical protein